MGECNKCGDDLLDLPSCAECGKEVCAACRFHCGRCGKTFCNGCRQWKNCTKCYNLLCASHDDVTCGSCADDPY